MSAAAASSSGRNSVEQPLTGRRAREAAPLFAALGDETRLKLLARMGRAGPLSVTSLTETANVTRQAISKHLAVLEEAGLVQSERVGRERIWKVEPKRLDDAKRCIESISAQWTEALDRLRDLVET